MNFRQTTKNGIHMTVYEKKNCVKVFSKKNGTHKVF